MKKIVYLFGAGASKGALPIVNEIPQRLLSFIGVLKLDMKIFEEEAKIKTINKSKKEVYNTLIQDLNWLSVESSKHASIDTFAKKLYIKYQSDELKRLKLSLSVFFIWEQLVNKPDKRYDAFYASIISRGISTLPTNIKVLSWNYDYQFELSYSEFSDDYDINRNQSLLNIISKYDKHTNPPNSFEIFKINGTTDLNNNDRYQKVSYISNFRGEYTKEVLESLITKYGLARFTENQLFSTLSFSWEGDNEENNVIDRAIKSTKDAEVLVVIGYSFPFFNREVDRKIINEMVNLKKVYFQAPDAEILMERFEAISNRSSAIKLVPKHDVGQFFLPNEL